MSHKYKLAPTQEQVTVLHKHCSDSRWVWNIALEQCQHAKVLGQYANNKMWSHNLTEARAWSGELQSGASMVQQQALRDLQQAFKNWWSNPGHFKHPTWRSLKKGNNGFRIVGLKWKRINRHWGEVFIPKAGWVRFRLSRAVPKTCKSARITLDSTGRWHISLTAEQPEFKREKTGAIVGIDMGVKHTITLSTGEHFSVPSELNYRRIAKQVSRKTRGSNRHARAKLRLAKRRAKSADRRKDWIEKMTTSLVRDFDIIAIEDLVIQDMLRSASGTVARPGTNVAQKRNLNRAIAQQGWGMFRKRLQDKAVAASSSVNVIAVKAAYTSQRCHECGHTCKENRDNQATFLCIKCDHTANADVNAAQNILAAGLSLLDVEGSSASTPMKRQSSHSDRVST